MSLHPATCLTLPAHTLCVDGSEKVATPSLRLKTFGEQPNTIWHAAKHLMGSWLGAVLGGSVYGAWAVWANWSQGASTAWGIGAAHWLTSTLLTFFGTMAMRWFYGRAAGLRNSFRGSLRACGGGLALTYGSLLTVHGLLGTEQLLLTLAPGIIPNIVFCASYALLLKRTMATETTVAP
jgi:hypothetical protein